VSEVFVEPAVEPGEPVEIEESPWTGPSQEDWGQVQNTLGYLAEFVQSQQAPPPEESGLSIDPFADDFGSQLAQVVNQAVQQGIAPVMTWQEQQQLGEAEQRAFDILQDDVSRHGEFMLGEKAYANVRAIANTYFEDEAKRHGFGPRAAEAALSRAASDWREYEKELASRAIEQHMNRLTDLSGAGREAASGAVAAQQVVSTPGGDELSLVHKYNGFPGV
jgi:hypothetical protein